MKVRNISTTVLGIIYTTLNVIDFANKDHSISYNQADFTIERYNQLLLGTYQIKSGTEMYQILSCNYGTSNIFRGTAMILSIVLLCSYVTLAPLIKHRYLAQLQTFLAPLILVEVNMSFFAQDDQNLCLSVIGSLLNKMM